MKLIFLGDSFTWGWGIDIEYGLFSGIIDDRKRHEVYDKNIYNIGLSESQIKELNDFRIQNNWVAQLCHDIKCDYENLATPGSSIEMMFIKFLESQKKKEINVSYVVCLPRTLSARILVSSKNHLNYFSKENDLSSLFSTYRIRSSDEDLSFFKKYFTEDSLAFIQLTNIIALISYFKSNKIPFIFLPTWENTIREQLIGYEDENINSIIKDYFKSFVLNEVDCDFSIDFKAIKKLPCGHPSSIGHTVIKEFYSRNKFFQFIKE